MRELQNIIERAIIFAESDVIEVSDIGLVGAGDVAEEAQVARVATTVAWRHMYRLRYMLHTTYTFSH